MTLISFPQASLDFEQDVTVPIRQLTIRMRETGVPVDHDGLRAECHSLDAGVSALQQAVDSQAGQHLPVSDGRRLAVFLRDQLGLPIPAAGRRNLSVSCEELRRHESRHPLVGHLRRLLEKKLLLRNASSLLEVVDSTTRRVHPEIIPDRHVAGRLICRNPPLDSLPRPLRRFVRTEGDRVLLATDFRHFELRILAHLSRDRALIRLLQDPGCDPHQMTASRALGVPLHSVTDAQRRVGKQLLFGIINGQTAFGIAETIGCSVAEAERMRSAFDTSFPNVRNWSEKVRRAAMAQGRVSTEFGRSRVLPDARSGESKSRNTALRQAISHVVQSTAAEHFQIRLVELARRLPAEARILLPLHDGLLMEAPREQAEAARDAVLTHLQANLPGSGIPMPVTIHVGPAWG